MTAESSQGPNSIASCAFLFNWVIYGGVLIHVTIDSEYSSVAVTVWRADVVDTVILIQRLYVIYGCSKRLLALLAVLMCARVVVETVVMGPVVAHMKRESLLDTKWTLTDRNMVPHSHNTSTLVPGLYPKQPEHALLVVLGLYAVPTGHLIWTGGLQVIHNCT